MAKATFIWDDENLVHVAKPGHELTPEEIEPVVNNPNNLVTFSDSSGLPAVFGTTKTGKYIFVVYEQVKDRPWTIRVKTAYPVSRPKRRR